jgi:hypothetical protein
MPAKEQVVIIMRCSRGHIVGRWLDSAKDVILQHCDRCREDAWELIPERSITATIVERE